MREKIKTVIEKLKVQVSDTFQAVYSFIEPPVKELLERYPILAEGVDRVGAFVSWFWKSLEPVFKGGGRKTLGYFLLYVAALLVFFAVGFDTDGFKNYLEGKVRAKTGNEITIEKLQFSFPPGIKLKGVILSSAATDSELRFSSLKIRPLFLTLFTGKPGVRLYVTEKDGSFTVDLSRKLFGDKVVGLSLSSKRFPVHAVIAKLWGRPLPVEALIDADGEIALVKSIGDAEGKLAVSLNGIKIHGGVFGEGLVKKLSPKSVNCSAVLGSRKLELKECLTETPLGEVELRVKTTLAKRLGRTPLLGSVVIRKPTGFLASLLEMNQRAKKPDGSYTIPLKGTLKNPRLAI